MVINFLWYWNRAAEICPNWQDGLRAALMELGKKHTVNILLGEFEPLDDADFLLFWGDSNCPFFDKIDKYIAKKGIILTTDPVNWNNLRKLDVVYCESQPIYDQVRTHGLHAVRAFGTDSDFYIPTQVQKDIKYFYPATFSPWKRQSAIAHLGKELVCIGTVQPDGERERHTCDDTGVIVLEGYLNPGVIRDCYNRAQYVPIPAIHGSERTCLEAMSMNIVPSVNPKNVRTLSFVEEYIHSEFNTPREFILANYSPQIYAKNLEKGML
ncbi:MAG TPA: hypothetical protein VF974_07555 [Patescibacteria group bacterium]